MSDNRPLGVFDSGVGGLTVLRALHDRLPLESTVYLGDLARCPYGVRSSQEIRRFAVQIADVLVERDIKLLVVACNTATAAAYDVLRDRYGLPVVGVIEPGARAAVQLTRTGRIGVVATDRTAASQAYTAAVQAILPEAVVVERAASWLVPVIERGPLARAVIAEGLGPILADLRHHEVDVLILGCTHFPIVRDIFQAEVGPGVCVVDSAETTAREVELLLRVTGMGAVRAPDHRWLVTGPAEAFAERAQVMFRASPTIEVVDLTLDPVM